MTNQTTTLTILCGTTITLARGFPLERLLHDIEFESGPLHGTLIRVAGDCQIPPLLAVYLYRHDDLVVHEQRGVEGRPGLFVGDHPFAAKRGKALFRQMRHHRGDQYDQHVERLASAHFPRTWALVLAIFGCSATANLLGERVDTRHRPY